jgi:hypothetical protein
MSILRYTYRSSIDLPCRTAALWTFMTALIALLLPSDLVAWVQNLVSRRHGWGVYGDAYFPVPPNAVARKYFVELLALCALH